MIFFSIFFLSRYYLKNKPVLIKNAFDKLFENVEDFKLEKIIEISNEKTYAVTLNSGNLKTKNGELNLKNCNFFTELFYL